MIKLIATDMDGTFLDSQKQFDWLFLNTYERLKRHGIRFVIASGNQYQRLYQRFLPMSHDFVFISENGSYIVDGEKELYANVIEKSTLKILNQILAPYTSIYMVYSGKKGAYLKNISASFDAVVNMHYCAIKHIETVDEIDDEIFKVAVYDPEEKIERFFDEIRNQLPSDLKVVTSGNMWMDIQNKNINKGIAIQFLQDKWKINRQECMAFGDQMNDYEMLQVVGHAYAMDNAVEPIKDIAQYCCLDNDQQGVIKTIEQYLDDLESES